MRRFLTAAVLAALMTAIASRADAGYLIIRVLLESNSGAGGPTELGGKMPGPRTPTGGLRPGSGDGPADGGYSSGGSSVLNPAGANAQDPTRSIVVVVPVEEDLTLWAPFYSTKAFHTTANPNWRPKLHLNYRGEKIVTNVFTDSSTVQLYETLKERPAFRKTYATEVRERHFKWAKTKSDPREGYGVLVSALEIGMVDEAVTYADQLLDSVKDKKDVAPEVAGFARAYAPMQKALKESAGKRGPAEFWRARLEAQDVAQGQHYSLLYWDATEPEVRRRLGLLEENFKGFFLAQAVRGVALTVPEAPLVAVLAKQKSDVYRLADVFDVPRRLSTDGFYAPGHDVLVLSPDRLDSVGLTFDALTQQMYQGGVGRAELLAGKGPNVDTHGANGWKKPDEVARMQTIALVERLADDAATMATISREGSLQLLYATGLVPRHVVLPEWLSQGAVNCFTRPKDPAFVTDAEKKWYVHVAPTTGYGGPNFVLHRQFKDIYGPLMEEKRDKKEQKEQREARLALLKNTLSDAYFLGLRDPKDVNDPDPVKADKTGVALSTGGTTAANVGGGFPGGPGVGSPGGPGGSPGPMGVGRPPRGGVGPGGEGGPTGGPWGLGQAMTGATTPEEDAATLARKKRARLAVKAQASAWALCYYLAKERPAELRAFVNEVAALPRDLPLDGGTVTTVFGRSFGLDGSNDSLTRFADAWMAYLATVPPAGIDIPLVEPKPAAGGAGGVGGPMGPP